MNPPAGDRRGADLPAFRAARAAAQLRSVGLRESGLGQRAALYPLIEDGLRPRAVRAVAAVELLDEDGEDTPALRRVDDDRGGGRQVGDDAVLEVEGDRGWAARLASQLRVLDAGIPLRWMSSPSR